MNDHYETEEPNLRWFDLGAPHQGRMAAIELGGPRRPVDLVFLHANGFNGQTYRSILKPLSAEQRILLPDQRGHGRSTLPATPEGRRSWDDLAGDLVALLDELGGPPVTLAGHSMGGTASVLAAVRRPERVRRLVLFDPVILPWPISLALRLGFGAKRFSGLRRLAEGAMRRKPSFPSRDAALNTYAGRGAFKTWSAEQLTDYVGGGFRDTADGTVELACAPAWEASNFLSHGHDVWGAMRQVRCPVQVLRAEKGSTCAVSHPTSAAMSICTVPGTSHFLPMERPDLVRELLVA